MKIYTKAGDQGKTSLIGGTRVPKSHIRIETYGTVDELNSFIGLLNDLVLDAKINSDLKDIVERIKLKMNVADDDQFIFVNKYGTKPIDKSYVNVKLKELLHKYDIQRELEFEIQDILKNYEIVVSFGANCYPQDLPHRGRWICWDKRVNENADKMLFPIIPSLGVIISESKNTGFC